MVAGVLRTVSIAGNFPSAKLWKALTCPLHEFCLTSACITLLTADLSSSIMSLCQTGENPSGQNLLTLTTEFFRGPCWWVVVVGCVPCTARLARHNVANRMGSTMLRTVLVFLRLAPGPTLCGSSDDGSE